ncbi:hypothetical protein [Oceanobacillus sp. FSL H7-0719]|uniref:hypothetical protein n=1 Tax=Oceanobacillus sp. FSL H7-0719 TaxID=2954507 RepID=UPI00324CB616
MAKNYYVSRYEMHRDGGFNPLEAFGVVASGIAVHGTLEDLKELDAHFQHDSSKHIGKILNKTEEFNYESITKSVSAV